MKRALFYFLMLCALVLPIACNDDDDDLDGNADVSGTWNANVAFQSCTPGDICGAFGLVAGTSRPAVLVINQDGSSLDGTYTYQGAGVSANMDGSIAGNQIVMNGAASVPGLGSITVNLTGPLGSNNRLSLAVTHQITLADGRSGTVNATGEFTR